MKNPFNFAGKVTLVTGAAAPDLLGPARTANGHLLRDVFVRLLITVHYIASNLRVDQAGVNRIHVDAFLDVLERRCSSKADNTVLRRYVWANTGIPGQ